MKIFFGVIAPETGDFEPGRTTIFGASGPSVSARLGFRRSFAMGAVRSGQFLPGTQPIRRATRRARALSIRT
ncbi:hypothetical protein ACWJKU_17590 [Methylocaldum sp. MU1018]